MTILVVGASGATGKLLVERLLEQKHVVKAIVRSPDRLPESWTKQENLEIIKASLLDLTDKELSEYVANCQAVASCLGHNLNWKGIYGQPRRLVTEAAQRLCKAINSNHPEKPVKYVLMNTSGNRNRDLDEPISMGEKIVIGLLRLLLPPHVDNEKAAEFLRTDIGPNDPVIEWVAVRPDNLIDEDEVSNYEIHPSPIRSAIFSPGKTSRINVGDFMARLIIDDDLWNKWKGQMPLIYNK